MRLPGFVHRKGEPFVSRITGTIDAPPYKAADFPRARAQKKPSGDPTADINEVRAALAIVPVENPDWSYWNRVGMAIWRATRGSDAGFEAWDQWSQGYTVARRHR